LGFADTGKGGKGQLEPFASLSELPQGKNILQGQGKVKKFYFESGKNLL